MVYNFRVQHESCFPSFLPWNLLHNSYREERSNGAFVSTLSSPVSFALLRYIRRVPGDVMLWANLREAVKVVQQCPPWSWDSWTADIFAMTSLLASSNILKQWSIQLLKLHCVCIVLDDATKNTSQLHGNMRIVRTLLLWRTNHCVTVYSLKRKPQKNRKPSGCTGIFCCVSSLSSCLYSRLNNKYMEPRSLHTLHTWI